MKPVEILYLLGLKPGPRTYPFEVRGFDLPQDGRVEYAQWLHPGETPKAIQQSSVDELRKFLSPGDVAIDIGAHTGDTTIPMALAVGRTGCVLALEPNPFVFPVLERNASLNRDQTNIVPLMIAATPSDGEFAFEYSDAGYCNGGLHEGISKWRHGHAFPLTVQGRHLPSLLDREYPSLVARIRYIKIDAEGYDATILRSLSGLITQTRPYLKAEVFRGTSAGQRRELYCTVAGYGYDVFRVASDSDYRGAALTEDDLDRWPHFDIFGVPR